MKDGFNKTAETVLYEKNIGSKSYYVVQAVPYTKKKTLYVVSAFIGVHGYKNGVSQLINTSKDPNATAKTGSVVTSKISIYKDTENFNSQIKKDSMPNGNIISRIGSKTDILSNNIISNDSENVNKKFSMKDSVEDNGELIAVHNIYRVTPKTACIG